MVTEAQPDASVRHLCGPPFTARSGTDLARPSEEPPVPAPGLTFAGRVLHAACYPSDDEAPSVHRHLVAGHEEQWPVEPEDPAGLEPHLVQQQHPGCCRRFAEDPHGSMMYRLGLGAPAAYYCSSGGATVTAHGGLARCPYPCR